jgi:AcrR family transcriptional regulator
MEADSAAGKRQAERASARSGRPRRQLAGEVEERILDAAGRVFLERGFEGASVDEIAEVARAGKPTIYARFPGKEALFAAVVLRKVRQVGALETIAETAGPIEARLTALACALLNKALAVETVGLMRSTIAEARRFPELASSVSRMARERGTELVARLLGELTQSDETRALPAFAADHLAVTARRFTDLVVLPMMIRALFGEDLGALRAEIAPHVTAAVSFFLAACRNGDG